MCQNSEFQRASSRCCVEKAGGVDLSMQRYKWENCAEEDCSLGASSRRCGTVSRRVVPKDGESGE